MFKTCELFRSNYNFLLSNIIKIVNQRIKKMKEDIFFNIRQQTSRQRMERMKRNRQIRKQKLYGKSYISEQISSPCIHGDQKQHIQKLKNRQAAQKSRQQKKLYVTQLEQQIKYLKMRLSQLRHCENCQKQLQNLPSQTQNTYEQSIMRRQEVEVTEQISSQQSSFVRISSTDENSSIGIYLFVFMIMVGVFCIGSRMESSDSFNPLRRDLTQLHSIIPQDNSLGTDGTTSYIYDNNMKTTYSTYAQTDADPKKYQNGLLSMDQVKSPSLISDEKYFQKIITSFENYKLDKYDQKNLRSKVGLIDANKSLLFCSRPKIYHSNPNNGGILTTFIDIFVKGAQITNIFPQSADSSLNSRSLQLNGLYKITASVEQIQEIVNPNMIY